MEMKSVMCECGYRLEMVPNRWIKAAQGLLGVIVCSNPKCKRVLNELITALYNATKGIKDDQDEHA